MILKEQYKCSINGVQQKRAKIGDHVIWRAAYVLDVLKGKTLQPVPDGYTWLEYIEGSGTQYINVGSTLTDGYIEVDFAPLRLTGSHENAYDGICGDNYAPQLAWYTSGWTTGKVGSNQPFMPVVGTKYTYTYIKSSGAFLIDSQSTGLTRTGNLPLKFLYSEGHAKPSRLYEVRQYSASGKIVRHLYPVKRNSDGEVGVYDVYSDSFYTNAGTGEFIKGNEITTPSYTFYEKMTSSGGAAIMTDIVPTLDYTVECKGIKPRNYSIFGSGMYDYTLTGHSNITYQYAHIGSGTASDKQVLIKTTIDNSQVHVWKISERKAWCDDDSSVASTNTVQPQYPLAIYGRSTSNEDINDVGSTTVYYCKIYNEENELIRHFIPAKRNSDGALGMYDLITKVFFNKFAGGTFIVNNKTGYSDDGVQLELESIGVPTTGDEPSGKYKVFCVVTDELTGEEKTHTVYLDQPLRRTLETADELTKTQVIRKIGVADETGYESISNSYYTLETPTVESIQWSSIPVMWDGDTIEWQPTQTESVHPTDVTFE